MSKRRLLAISMTLLFAAACAAPRLATRARPEEQARQDSSLAHAWVTNLEGQLSLQRDAEVERYLSKLAATIASRTDLKMTNDPSVQLLRDDKRPSRSFSLPSGRIYLPTRWLRLLETDSEAASLLAFELAHLKARHCVTRFDALGRPAQPEFFGPSGIFAWSEDELRGAASLAVELLYSAGYDPRGLSLLWSRLSAGAELSAFSRAELEVLSQSTREAISVRSPLRNPIVRTEAFLKLKKRIQSL